MAALPQVIFESNSILNGIQFVLQDTTQDDYTQRILRNSAFRINGAHTKLTTGNRQHLSLNSGVVTYTVNDAIDVKRYSFTCLQLMIFPQMDYAAVQSNKHGDILVDHQTIVEVPIQPRFFDSSAAVRGVTPKIRRCYYPEEGRQLLNQSYYSLDECILVCRIESMVQHCGCASSPLAGSARNVTYCNLLDLPCLMKWRGVWNGMDEYPYIQADVASTSQCPHCLPTCDGVNFAIVSNAAPLRNTYNSSGYFHGLLKGLTNDRPLSIIKLFFKLRFAQATKMDMVGDWVVLLNRFGGILSLMYGFSIISYIEILYYLTGKWFVYYYRAFKGPKESTQIAPHESSLNWNELMPRGNYKSTNIISNVNNI